MFQWKLFMFQWKLFMQIIVAYQPDRGHYHNFHFMWTIINQNGLCLISILNVSLELINLF